MYTILLVAHTIIVLFLIVMVLLQRTESDGLSGLSGGGGNQFMTGRGAANLMTKTTAFLAAAFMLTSLVLAIMASRYTSKSVLDSAPIEATGVEQPANGAATTEKTAPTEQKPQAPVVPKGE